MEESTTPFSEGPRLLLPYYFKPMTRLQCIQSSEWIEEYAKEVLELADKMATSSLHFHFLKFDYISSKGNLRFLIFQKQNILSKYRYLIFILNSANNLNAFEKFIR